VTVLQKNTHEIISNLNFCKVSACQVPKMVTKKHKNKTMAASLENLCRYQEGESFVKSIVMGDETWVYQFTPESKINLLLGNILIRPLPKNSKLSHLPKKKKKKPGSGIVKASSCVNFSHQKQPTATYTAKLSKNCTKPLNVKDQDNCLQD
jgi:hypothetical protein